MPVSLRGTVGTYVSASISCKGCVVSMQAKLVMRAAAKLAPKEVLGAVGPLQQTCLSLATTGDNAAAAAAAAGGSGVRCTLLLCPKQSSE